MFAINTVKSLEKPTVVSADVSAAICHSYCYHCGVTTPWKIRRILSDERIAQISHIAQINAHQLSCANCYSPIDICAVELAQIKQQLSDHPSIQDSHIHRELNQRIERRQQACQIASQGNWLSGIA